MLKGIVDYGVQKRNKGSKAREELNMGQANSQKTKKADRNKGLNSPVFKDFRGEIHRHDFYGVKFNVLYTKKGVYRSGDYHPFSQYDLILKGKFHLTLRKGGKDIVAEKGPNEFISIPPNTPHLFKALSDSVMLEWWGGKFECKYYPPYRKFIESQIQKHQAIGRKSPSNAKKA